MAFGRCGEHDLPLAVRMGGGYADDVDEIVEIHFGTVALAAAAARRVGATRSSLWAFVVSGGLKPCARFGHLIPQHERCPCPAHA